MYQCHGVVMNMVNGGVTMQYVFWTQVHGPARCDIDLAKINPLKLVVCM